MFLKRDHFVEESSLLREFAYFSALCTFYANQVAFTVRSGRGHLYFVTPFNNMLIIVV